MDGNNVYDDLTRYTTGGMETALYQMQDNRRRNKTWKAQLDYVDKWGKNHRLEAGYKGSFCRENSPVRTYSGSTAADAVFDASLYNHFIYDQDIHVLYLTYGGRTIKLSGRTTQGIHPDYSLVYGDAHADRSFTVFQKYYFFDDE